LSTLDILQQRAAERQALLVRAVTLLNNDERVVAAWLYGSLGRGTEDALSDIDLWVVVQDEHIEAVRDKREEYAAVLGNPLLVVDAPQNAPPNGAFLTVLYEGKVAGPQHVDWTWQAQSAASIPSDVKLLLRRVDIPHKPAAAPQPPEALARAVTREMAFFWMMVPVAAKYVVRHRPWMVVNLLAIILHSLDKVRLLLDAGETPPEHSTHSSTPPPVHPIEQLTYLRRLAEEAEELVPGTDRGGNGVTSYAMSQVYESIDLAFTTLDENR
jgi:predicted nucleotidyltransferase